MIDPPAQNPSPIRRFLRWVANEIRFAGPTIAMSTQLDRQNRPANLTDSAMLTNAARDLGKRASDQDEELPGDR
jgi:hypothetical protein